MIISEDGLRPDALMGVRPPVHEAILKRAAYSLTARTIRRASTLPSHAAMLSGFDVKEHGLYWNSWKPERGYIHVPTVFDAAEKSGGASAAFVGKQKLEHIAHPGSVDMFSRPGYFCKKVVDEAARYFVEKQPADRVHPLLRSRRSRPLRRLDVEPAARGRPPHRQVPGARCSTPSSAAGLDRETLFIISADHGGHGHNHDGKIKEDRLIPWIAWGPGIRARPPHRGRHQHRRHRRHRAVGARLSGAPRHRSASPVLEAFEPELAAVTLET